jgi:hypothetical protein
LTSGGFLLPKGSIVNVKLRVTRKSGIVEDDGSNEIESIELAEMGGEGLKGFEEDLTLKESLTRILERRKAKEESHVEEEEFTEQPTEDFSVHSQAPVAVQWRSLKGCYYESFFHPCCGRKEKMRQCGRVNWINPNSYHPGKVLYRSLLYPA